MHYLVVVIFMLLAARQEQFAYAINERSNVSITEIGTSGKYFTSLIVDRLLKLKAFRTKFDVPYIDIQTSLTYVREIGRATALYSTLYDRPGVQEFMEKSLLTKFLTGSDCCRSLDCSAKAIGQILAELLISLGFDLTKMPQNVARMYAVNFSGNIAWRLSRIINPPTNITSVEMVKNVQLVDLLSAEMQKSSYIHDFQQSKLAHRTKYLVLSSSVCSSEYLNFKFSLSSELSNKMANLYDRSKEILEVNSEYVLEYPLTTAVFSEVLVLNMVERNNLLSKKKSKEIMDDIMKFIKLGITISKMSLGTTNIFHLRK